MTAYIDTCDDCTRCTCGRRWCPREVVSPGEANGICVDCFERGEVA